MHNALVDRDELTGRQRFSLWLDGHTGLHTADDAAGFLSEVGLALRYNATAKLPLASMYRATQLQVPVPEREQLARPRAFALTNDLLARGEAVEINLVVANRLVLISPRLLPAVYALRRRREDEPDLSDLARQALEFIAAHDAASSGDVRRYLNVSAGAARPDAADLALAELQRELLVDRGPAGPQTGGIFYLTREGYPYRMLARAHPHIRCAAARLSSQRACLELVESYLRGAVFASPRTLHSLFRLLLSREEIEQNLTALIDAGRAARARVGRTDVVVFGATPSR